MSDCKAYRHELAEACEGFELSPGARKHLGSCRHCGDELRRGERLRALVGGLGRVKAPADFDTRLRARMVAVKAPAHRTPLGGLRLIYALAPVAVVACFLVVTAALYFRQSSPTTPAVSSVETVRSEGRADAAGSHSETVAEESERDDERVEAAAQKALTAGGGRVVRKQRLDRRQQKEVAPRSRGTGSLSPDTTLASFGSAPVITGRNVTIALKAPAEPLRMILRDERGAGRVVPLRAVSFGSQEMLAREGATRQAAAAKDEGVW